MGVILLRGAQNTAAARVDEDEEEKKSSKAMMCFIIVLVLILVLASVDAMTTKYFKRMCTALATWTRWVEWEWCFDPQPSAMNKAVIISVLHVIPYHFELAEPYTNDFRM